MPIYHVFVYDNEELEMLCDNIVMGDENAKEMFLKYQERYTSGEYEHCTVDAHPMFFNDKGILLEDIETWVCW